MSKQVEEIRVVEKGVEYKIRGVDIDGYSQQVPIGVSENGYGVLMDRRTGYLTPYEMRLNGVWEPIPMGYGKHKSYKALDVEDMLGLRGTKGYLETETGYRVETRWGLLNLMESPEMRLGEVELDGSIDTTGIELRWFRCVVVDGKVLLSKEQLERLIIGEITGEIEMGEVDEVEEWVWVLVGEELRYGIKRGKLNSVEVYKVCG